MNRGLRLFLYSLRRVRYLTVITALLLCAFQIMLIVVARFVERNGGFAQLTALIPPFARELAGPYLGALMSFAGVVCAGFGDLGILGAMVAVAVGTGTMLAAEVESGFVDLILARAVPRGWLVTRSIAAILTCVVFLLGMMTLGTWIGLQTLAPRTVEWPTVAMVATIVGNLALMLIAWGAVALAIASISRRRSLANAIAGLLAVTSYLVDYVARLWTPAQTMQWLSPFHYYKPFDLISGNPLPLRNVAVLALIAAAGFAAAYAIFSRRDISH